MHCDRKFLLRMGLYLLGLFILALGVAFSVNSGLGVSPVNSLPYVLSQVLGVSLGRCTTGVFCFYLLMQILLLRRRFQWVNLSQLLFSAVFGYFVNAAKALLGSFTLPGYVGSLGMLAVSIGLIALGILLIVDVRLVPMPMEGLTLAITSMQKRLAFHQVKMIVDCLAVLAAVLLSLLLLGGVVGVREGTLITALAAGWVIGQLQRPLKPRIERLCF